MSGLCRVARTGYTAGLMQFFQYREDRLPVLLMLSLSAINFAIYWWVRDPRLLVLWTLVGIIPKGWTCAWNHHHQHVMTFRQPILNRLLEIPYCFLTGITSHGWVLHHVVGHHRNYMNQDLDESRWRHKDGRVMTEAYYTFHNTLWAYPRCLAMGLRRPKYLPVFLGMAALNLTLLGLAFAHAPLAALLVYAIPMLVSLTLTVQATYDHHAGLFSTDPMTASYNVMDRWYNLATLNLGYHTAHHYRPIVHWSRLPELHAKIAPQIPKELYRPPGAPFSWIYAARRFLGGLFGGGLTTP